LKMLGLYLDADIPSGLRFNPGLLPSAVNITPLRYLKTLDLGLSSIRNTFGVASFLEEMTVPGVNIEAGCLWSDPDVPLSWVLQRQEDLRQVNIHMHMFRGLRSRDREMISELVDKLADLTRELAEVKECSREKFRDADHEEEPYSVG